MDSSRRPGPLVAACCLLALVATSCAADPPTERFRPAATAPAGTQDITYWSEGDESLQLDACAPPPGTVLPRAAAAGTADAADPAAEPATDPPAASADPPAASADPPAASADPPADPAVPAVVIVHGGGFTTGGRTDPGVRALCTDVAALGVVAFAISYRLAPAHVYPDQVDDLARAVAWLREPAQVQRFGLDPARIAVVGSSAGAILAQQLATRGEGPLDQGSRVAAVVSLSGVSVMGPEALTLGKPTPAAAEVVLGYLGCEAVTRCPQAQEASPVTSVDPTDSPVLLVNGSDELVPAQQAEAMGQALRAAGVSEQVVIRPGDRHGLALLDTTVRSDVKTFLEEHL